MPNASVVAEACINLQSSLAWCEGAPVFPGIKRRIYFVAKSDIAQWPIMEESLGGRPVAPYYLGPLTLRADKYWHYMDVLPDKCQVTSEAQGEFPSQTQLNKLTAVHPGVNGKATLSAAYLNNSDNVYLVEDMRGHFRMIGSERWPTKTTVKQDLGQGPTGTAATTIEVEATDVIPAPFYVGPFETLDETGAPVIINSGLIDGAPERDDVIASLMA